MSTKKNQMTVAMNVGRMVKDMIIEATPEWWAGASSKDIVGHGIFVHEGKSLMNPDCLVTVVWESTEWTTGEFVDRVMDNLVDQGCYAIHVESLSSYEVGIYWYGADGEAMVKSELAASSSLAAPASEAVSACEEESLSPGGDGDWDATNDPRVRVASLATEFGDRGAFTERWTFLLMYEGEETEEVDVDAHPGLSETVVAKAVQYVCERDYQPGMCVGRGERRFGMYL